MTLLDVSDVLVYGEKKKLPDSLYIPPEALRVHLESFSGPLDLLWYLIRKSEINILDIPMSILTAQYLTYVDEIVSQNLGLAAEYLLMAALLLDIKARCLLPVVKNEDDPESEAVDPREDLVKRLMLYEQVSGAAHYLAEQTIVGRDCTPVEVFCEIPPALQPLPDLAVIISSWQKIVRSTSFQEPHQIMREVLVVSDFMILLRQHLKASRFLVFQDLCRHTPDVRYVVVYFLAMLELVRLKEVELVQQEPLSPLYCRQREVSCEHQGA